MRLADLETPVPVVDLDRDPIVGYQTNTVGTVAALA